MAAGLTVLRRSPRAGAGTRTNTRRAAVPRSVRTGGDLRLRVGELSYGQRRRIELARLVSEPVDLVLLDEPTNHLSPALVEELEPALTDYRVRVVIVTHDRRMRRGSPAPGWSCARGRWPEDGETRGLPCAFRCWGAWRSPRLPGGGAGCCRSPRPRCAGPLESGFSHRPALGRQWSPRRKMPGQALVCRCSA